MSGTKGGKDETDGPESLPEADVPTSPPGFPYSQEFPTVDPMLLSESAQERLSWAQDEGASLPPGPFDGRARPWQRSRP